MSRLDTDGSRTVDLKEFCDYFFKLGVNNIISERVFKAIDKNGDGDVTTFEFFQFRAQFTAEQLRTLLPEFCPQSSKTQEATKKKEQPLKQGPEERKRQDDKERLRKEENKLTLEKLRQKTFKELKDLCIENNIPSHGTRVQLLNKLETKLFPKSASTNNENNKANKSMAETKQNNYQPSVVVVANKEDKHVGTESLVEAMLRAKVPNEKKNSN